MIRIQRWGSQTFLGHPAGPPQPSERHTRKVLREGRRNVKLQLLRPEIRSVNLEQRTQLPAKKEAACRYHDGAVLRL